MKRGKAGGRNAAILEETGIPMLPMVGGVASGGLDHDGLEALGLAQEQARRRESTGSLSSKYWLSLLPQPPRHPFARTYFPVKVVLVDSKRALKSGWSIQLHVELLYENGELVPNQSKHVEVHGHPADGSRPIILGPSGSIDLKVRVLTCSSVHENKSFFLRFSGMPADKNIPTYATIMPATSTLMTVIRHRLRVIEQPPQLWYKDEGGRDKCIAISGLLVDEHEQAVQGREVPLKVILAYEGEDCTEVKNQSILKMPTDSLPKVDKFGKFHIKVRIEEVSKNHQRQAFVIKLAPDVAFSAENYDISADVSSAITVLSKRNKRRPKREGAEEDSPELKPTQVHQGGVGGVPYQPVLYTATAAAAGAYAKPSVQQTVSLVPNLTLPHAASSVLPTITPTGAVAKPHTLASTSLTGAGMARLTSNDGSLAGGLNAENSTVSYKPSTSSSFSETISHLINWCSHAHDLLTKIEWQHVGFEVQEDGQMNLHRPLYRCPGCWSYQDTIRQTGHKDTCKVSKLSSAYRTHVHVYLQDLLTMATGTSASTVGGNSIMMPSPSSITGAGVSGTNPSQIANANSLMAAYSKNNSGNVFMSHQNSLQNSNSPTQPNAAASNTLPGTSTGGLQHRTSNPYPIGSASSILNNLGLTHTNSGLGGSAVLSRPSSLLKQPSMTGQTGGGNPQTQSPSQLQSSADEPNAKRVKTQQTTDSASLFPPSSGDWSALTTLDPLSSPNGLIDRGISALGPALGVDRGMSVLDQGGMVGNSFAAMSAFHGGHDGADASAFMSDSLPGDLSLLRAGSSINLDTLMTGGTTNSGSTHSANTSEEVAVDAIHVTATPFGFPAFSASTTSGPNSTASLVGFYQYDESTTYLAFVPVSKFPQVTPAQIREMEKIYRGLRAEQDAAGAQSEVGQASRILTRQHCITLEKLKEEALLLHYASQMTSQATGFLAAENY